MRSTIMSPIQAAVLAALSVVACQDTPGPSSFVGVQDGLPTGSRGVALDGLVAAYDMSTLAEGGRVRDFGPHGLHGTFSSSRVITSPFGQARDLSEVGFRVNLPEDPAFDLDGPLTIATWLRVDTGSLHQHIVACDDKWALWITPDNRFRLGDTRGGGWSTPPETVELGTWTALVAVLSATRDQELTTDVAAIYVDGELVPAERHMRTTEAQTRVTWGPGELYPTDACYIGFESHQGNEGHQEMPFAGGVDELVISGRAWSANEVAAFSTQGT